jgi:hypothetical protein
MLQQLASFCIHILYYIYIYILCKCLNCALPKRSQQRSVQVSHDFQSSASCARKQRGRQCRRRACLITTFAPKILQFIPNQTHRQQLAPWPRIPAASHRCFHRLKVIGGQAAQRCQTPFQISIFDEFQAARQQICRSSVHNIPHRLHLHFHFGTGRSLPRRDRQQLRLQRRFPVLHHAV